MIKPLSPCPHCGGRINYVYDVLMIPYGVVCNQFHMIVKYTRIKPPQSRETFERVLGEIADKWNERITGEQND